MMSRRRDGFTLVELLVVISIIALLASSLLVAMAGVQETARVDRTRAQIAKINALITERWESYKTRRIPVMTNGMELASRNTLMNPRESARDTAIQRINSLRELMRMELPERKSDVIDGPQAIAMGPTSFAPQPSGLWRAYRSTAARLLLKNRNIVLPADNPPFNGKNDFGAQLDREWTSQYQGSECLYLILSQITEDDRRALEFFATNEVVDRDNDGIPEIVDGWGTEIRFLRWAPGINVIPNSNPPQYGPAQIPGSPQDITIADPFDPRRTEQLKLDEQGKPRTSFALFPLVLSAGPDKEWDVVFDLDTPLRYSLIYNNPYVGQYRLLGSLRDLNNNGKDDSVDNISNHNLVAGS